MYSNPPLHGASTASTILKNSDMYNEWRVELKAMADRIISMWKQLFDALTAKGDCSHITKQIGMFTFTGLNSDQVAFMTKEYHIYMTSDGSENHFSSHYSCMSHDKIIHANVMTDECEYH
ncbi:hypothetical protein F3Y22_tig00111234pilonHSYRG00049 [Hibiscus syriacus]|uniref:Aminotransferase class I/classII large domain-containing protein n=1 Tax=Hibiscus syriacus TaxID=106335 RepID=A0A6A2YU38_HIBSY|nr:hypothetical protein F3Y22_tig00111234pilonHSYRG00049 [Hibiscus syriacus]